MESAESPGDPLWARGVIEQNYRWLLAYAFAAVGDQNVAHDIVQETFRIAYERRDKYQPAFTFGAWLRGIARNLIKREAEKRARSFRVLSPEFLEGVEEVASRLEAAHVAEGYEELRLKSLRLCLEQASGKVRELLELRYAQNLSLKELAARLGVGTSGVGMALQRAHAAVSLCLRKRLAPGFAPSET